MEQKQEIRKGLRRLKQELQDAAEIQWHRMRYRAYLLYYGMVWRWYGGQKKCEAFDEKLYDRMRDKFVFGVPVAFEIQHLAPQKIGENGRCYERALYMCLCFDEAVYVQAKVLDLALLYGEDRATHCWMELGDEVYDPSLCMKMDKKLYYALFRPWKVHKFNRSEVEERFGPTYDSYWWKLEDYLPGGYRRIELAIIVPKLEELAKKNAELKSDLEVWKKRVDYDKERILGETDDQLSAVLALLNPPKDLVVI